MRPYLAAHALPWFGLGALLVIVGSVALHDPAESYVVVAAPRAGRGGSPTR